MKLTHMLGDMIARGRMAEGEVVIREWQRGKG